MVAGGRTLRGKSLGAALGWPHVPVRKENSGSEVARLEMQGTAGVLCPFFRLVPSYLPSSGALPGCQVMIAAWLADLCVLGTLRKLHLFSFFFPPECDRGALKSGKVFFVLFSKPLSSARPGLLCNRDANSTGNLREWARKGAGVGDDFTIV